MMSAPKYDNGKQKWHAMPLVVLEELANVFEAGATKYHKFSCLEGFENQQERLWDAMMRHLSKCQVDPLAVDEETGCYHGYQAAWNIIMLTHLEKQQRATNENN